MIGAGHIARSHALVWQNEARITAICSRQRRKAQRLAEEFGIPLVCDDADDLIACTDVDIVSIATPPHLHHPLSIKAMNAGKHVFCEKPLALDLQQAREMWSYAQRTGVKTGVQFSERVHWPSLIWMRDLIHAGDIGDIQYFEGFWAFNWARSAAHPMSWRFRRDLAGSGALGDLGAYMIDAARWLVGEFTGVCGHLETIIRRRPVISELYDFTELRRMSRKGTFPESTETAEVENDDTCLILATFDTGAHGIIRASRLQCINTIRVEGTHGTFSWDLQSTRLLRRRPDEDQFTEIPAPEWITPSSMATRFLANIKNDTDLPPTFYDGLRVQQVIDAVVRSAQERRWIAVG